MRERIIQLPIITSLIFAVWLILGSRRKQIPPSPVSVSMSQQISAEHIPGGAGEGDESSPDDDKPSLFAVEDEQPSAPSKGITVWRQSPEDRRRIAEFAAKARVDWEKAEDQSELRPKSLFLDVSPVEWKRLEREFRDRIGEWGTASCDAFEDHENYRELKEQSLNRPAMAGLRRILDSEIRVIDSRFLEESKPLCYFRIGEVELEFHYGLLVNRTPDKHTIGWNDVAVQHLSEIFFDQATEPTFDVIQQALTKIGRDFRR